MLVTLLSAKDYLFTLWHIHMPVDYSMFMPILKLLLLSAVSIVAFHGSAVTTTHKCVCVHAHVHTQRVTS